MTTPARLRSQLHAIAALHANVAERLPAFLATTRAIADQHDGYPTTASGADRGGTSSTSDTTSTERAVLARLSTSSGTGPVRAWDDVEDLLRAVALGYSNVLSVFNEYVERMTEDDKRRARCTGDGTPDGAACTAWAEPGRKGMCIACYKRSWRAQRGTSGTDAERAA